MCTDRPYLARLLPLHGRDEAAYQQAGFWKRRPPDKESATRVEFRTRHKFGSPQHHIADVEIIFDAGAAAGLCLSGFSLWLRKDGRRGIALTVPSRRDPGSGKYYPHLRNNVEGSRALHRLKTLIFRAYVERYPEEAARLGESLR